MKNRKKEKNRNIISKFYRHQSIITLIHHLNDDFMVYKLCTMANKYRKARLRVQLMRNVNVCITLNNDIDHIINVS